MSFVFLAIEDALSEAVGRSLIKSKLDSAIEINALSRGGNGYLRSNIAKFTQIAQHATLLMLTDLDNKECAPRLKQEWFSGFDLPERFIFRVCVREVESWILADRVGFSEFLGISAEAITIDVESLVDPKTELLRLARKARREIRSELLPQKGSQARQGLGYNNVLCRFVEETWSGERASENSNSLKRALERLNDAQRFFTTN